MSGKRADLNEIRRLAKYNRDNRVGVPSKGERICTRCEGAGQLNKAIPQGQFMGGHFMPCDRCCGTGCTKDGSKGNPNE